MNNYYVVNYSYYYILCIIMVPGIFIVCVHVYCNTYLLENSFYVVILFYVV